MISARFPSVAPLHSHPLGIVAHDLDTSQILGTWSAIIQLTLRNSPSVGCLKNSLVSAGNSHWACKKIGLDKCEEYSRASQNGGIRTARGPGESRDGIAIRGFSVCMYFFSRAV